jgi:predicted AlkP superfamily pyrophosphatase or phosphodiesterase
MADYYNSYPLKAFAATVAECIGVEVGEEYAPSIKYLPPILKDRAGGIFNKVVLYHADAVGMYMWQKYTSLFAPVYKHTTLSVPFVSTVESVTPVAHASMYTGLDPSGHGIETYVRPRLVCDTLFDRLIVAGKKVAIVAMDDSTFLHIFAGRALDYYEVKNSSEINDKVIELIEADKYDVISVHTFGYDSAAHAYGPESKEAINALSMEAENFANIAEKLKECKGDNRILLTYSPDHGQHLTDGGLGAHGSKLIEDMNVLHFFGVI